jgi:phage FluMu protein Com
MIKFYREMKEKGLGKCTKCGEIKSIEEFQRTSHICKKCVRNKNLMHAYGITLKDFNDLLLKQGNRCAICNNFFDWISYKPELDHNHVTKEIRGILCRKCNRQISVIEDSSFVENALKYISHFSMHNNKTR